MSEWARKIREGDARALARAATGIENRNPEALALLAELPQGAARVVGITGPPGAGKSTLVDAMAAALRRRGKTVAILAVDPSSHATGGAILGDRIRMQRHHADPGIFIRSMATRGAAGGLARATAGMVRLMDGAGRDCVIVETVGVGQGEVEIARLAHVTVVVLVPGMGDDVQAIKAGIMEIADIFAINKADLPGADRVEREVQAMLSLAEAPKPPIVRTVATDGTGVDELIDRIFAAPVRVHAANAGGVGVDCAGIAVKCLDEAELLYRGLGLEPAGPDLPVAKLLEERGPGLHHLALRVPDLARAVERLRASGARLLHEPGAGAGGRLYVFVYPASAGGVLLELIQER